MFSQKTACFSPDSRYFASCSFERKLFVWETSTNTCIIDYNLNSSVYGVCTSLLWIPLKYKSPSKKSKLTRNQASLNQLLLALGTNIGDVILYNVTAQNLHSHFRSWHLDSINDLAFCHEAHSLATCSKDFSVAVWDITSGRQSSKWTTEESPSCMCFLDVNNLLTANTSILWWNILEKTILKKFSGHGTEIFKLLPVNIDLSLKSCCVLSAAVGDLNINAWSLSSNVSHIPVASFASSGLPQDMDVSSISAKDNPLVLAVFTKEGNFNLFEHILNENANESLHPKTTIRIDLEQPNNEKTGDMVISSKLSSDCQSCLIAYGHDKDSMVFMNIKIKNANKPDKKISEDSTLSGYYPEDKIAVSKKYLPVNGIQDQENDKKASKKSTISPRKNGSDYDKSSSKQCSAPLKFPDSNADLSSEVHEMNSKNITDFKSSVTSMDQGLEKQKRDFMKAVLCHGDAEFISNYVKTLPTNALKYILEELNNELKYKQPYPNSLKWIKEIFRIHLRYFSENPDAEEIIQNLKESLKRKYVPETLPKLIGLRGVLNLLNWSEQFATSEESDSEE